MNIYLLCFATISTTAVSSTRYGRIIGTSDGIVPIDIALDNDHMISTSGTPNPLPPKFIRTVNYHDYVVGFAALKDIDGKTCYIKKTNETYQQAKTILDNIVPGRDHFVHQRKMFAVISGNKLTDVKEFAGDAIARFCESYDTYDMHFKDTQENKRDADSQQAHCPTQKIDISSIPLGL